MHTLINPTPLQSVAQSVHRYNCIATYAAATRLMILILFPHSLYAKLMNFLLDIRRRVCVSGNAYILLTLSWLQRTHSPHSLEPKQSHINIWAIFNDGKQSEKSLKRNFKSGSKATSLVRTRMYESVCESACVCQCVKSCRALSCPQYSVDHVCAYAASSARWWFSLSAWQTVRKE